MSDTRRPIGNTYFSWCNMVFQMKVKMCSGYLNSVHTPVGSQMDNNWILKRFNVTGPPGALLFDRDQRSHWNNHYDCCFVRITALGIYCTDFLPQLLSQVKYPMQSIGHHISQVVTNRYWNTQQQLNNSIGNWTALSEETSLHWATMHWMTGIRNNEIFCGFGWEWHVITSQQWIYQNRQKCEICTGMQWTFGI